MSGEVNLMLCIFLWGLGFVSSWLYATAKIKNLERQNENLQNALQYAGETIMGQSEEIHTILAHAQKCEAEFIN